MRVFGAVCAVHDLCACCLALLYAHHSLSLSLTHTHTHPYCPFYLGAGTTLCIAHRLSTLANADRIIVLDKGVVIEDGSHTALMSKKDGKYRALAMIQQSGLST